MVFGANFTGAVTHLGTNGNDTVVGNAADNNLNGAQGNDTLDGGAGDDLLTGGEGNDLFVFGDGDGDDTVTDFEVGVDAIDLSNFGVDFSVASNFDAFMANDAADVGNNVVLDLDADDSLTLLGINKVDLSASDFVT